MCFMTDWFFTLFAANELPAPLMLPDSVQKANFAEAIQRIANIRLDDLLRSLLSEMVWVVVKLLVALFIYIIGRWIMRRILRMLDSLFERRQVDLSLRSFLRTTAKVIFSLILILIVVQTLGVNVTSLIAVFSAATLAIGMALSGTAQNFAGGLLILMMKPYRVGDYIMAQGQAGTVLDIKLFSTVIQTTDNRTIYIPNNTIATSIIDNYTTAPLRRIEWSVAISYGDSVETARTAIMEILRADKRIVEQPEPVVWVGALADSSVNLTVRAWVKNPDYWDVFYHCNEQFYNELPARGIRFPFPQLQLHTDAEKQTPTHENP